MSYYSAAWSEANQRYLSGSVNLLCRQLMYNAARLKNDNPADEQQELTEAATQLMALGASMSEPPAIEQLALVLGLSSFEKNILLLCAAPELDTAMSEQLSVITGDASLSAPSFGLLLGLLPDAHWTALSPDGPLRYWRLVEMNKSSLITRSPIKIDEYILHYLTGISCVHEKIREIAEKVNDGLPLVASHKATAENILQTISSLDKTNAPFPVIQLSGIDQTGKRKVAAHVSTGMRSSLYRASFYALPAGVKEGAELARLWSREAALHKYVLMIDGADIDMNDKVRISTVISFIENIQGLVIINSEQWTPELKRGKIVFDVAKPLPAEQALLWQNIPGADMMISPAMIAEVVSQFDLSADIIQKAGLEFVHQQSGDAGTEEERSKKLWLACCKHTRPQVDELAQRISPEACWTDIVLPDAQKSILREIAAQVKQRNRVYNEWGFGGKSSRGLGISALFAGESGTGKTMAAEVLANELGLDLYRIDLSKVVNKYIGETEKNLKKIFDSAEEGGAILLFDEADALFGKRSDVKDSHDRYSNIEVSYLLQRMEAYRGLAILTTNMRHALDKAFTRRIRFIVQFPFPDAVQRAEIWSKVFPGNTPRLGLDMEKLSRLTIAGGSIRNIAMNAAFYAADEDSPVLMTHIFRAARTEYEKTEKPFNTADLRIWQ